VALSYGSLAPSVRNIARCTIAPSTSRAAPTSPVAVAVIVASSHPRTHTPARCAYDLCLSENPLDYVLGNGGTLVCGFPKVGMGRVYGAVLSPRVLLEVATSYRIPGPGRSAGSPQWWASCSCTGGSDILAAANSSRIGTATSIWGATLIEESAGTPDVVRDRNDTRGSARQMRRHR
jgi:hypothetical protein